MWSPNQKQTLQIWEMNFSFSQCNRIPPQKQHFSRKLICIQGLLCYDRIMEDMKKLTDRIEYLFLRIIVTGLRNNNITVSEAKDYANQLLPIEPFASNDDAIQKVHAFCLRNSKFNELKEFVDSLHEEKNIHDKVEDMKRLIRDNKIDQALEVANKK